MALKVQGVIHQRHVLAKTVFLDSPSLSNIVRFEHTPLPCPTSSVWKTPPPPVHGRPDRIASKNVRNAKYIVIWTPVDGGGVSDSNTLFFSFFRRPVDGRPLVPPPSFEVVHIATHTPPPPFDRTSLMDGP